ncbi:copper fist DNA binding domain-containing protein [Coniochaeta sp. 2T2.1]|nr:copper fist DNA binding domain-containing protein [Coniochaeta sp. 2T2.1]
MPLINGQKMACAPCIRGHRSTKCNHSADRVMVPVRKPGRPLSSCACPPGQSCACGGIKVAIPRKQKCKCGSDPTNGDHEGHDIVKPEMPTPAPTPSELPVSPRNGVFRVQKTAPNPRQNGRKQSFDPVNLERIDPNSVNIINGYATNNNTNHTESPNGANGASGINATNGMPPQGLGQPMPGMAFVPTLPTTSYQQPGIISYGPPLGYALVPIHSHLNSPPLPMAHGPPQSAYYPPPNGISVPAPNGAIRSCCAPGPAHISQPQQQVSQPQPQVQPPQQAQTQQPSEPPKKSCCGGGTKNDTSHGPGAATQQATRSFAHALAQHQQSFAELKQQQHHQQQQQHEQQQEPFAVSYPNNSTVFTYPPSMGTWNVPLNPAMWAQLQQQATQQQPQPQPQTYRNSLPPTPNGGTTPALGTPTMGTSHECSCGPGCQCVGCLAHPFNSQTLEYVGAAWDYDVEVPYGNNNSPAKAPAAGPTAQNGSHAPVVQPNGNGINSHGTSGANDHITNGTQQQQHEPANPDVGSPPQAHTPSDASGFNEELSADNFMFVNLPLYQCGGSLAFCPCGDDCQCVGSHGWGAFF